MNLLGQIKLGESKILEFKEQLPSNDRITKTVIAFSNTAGGKLIIGINDNREIVGIDEKNIFDLQDRIASIIFDNCYPNILPEIYTENINGKLLLVIEVYRGSLLPYYLKNEGKNNGTYIRIGATNRKAEFDYIIELERHKRHFSYDEDLNYDVEFDTVDLSSLKKQFADAGKILDTHKMLNLRLIKEHNGKIYPTNALLILTGFYPHCTVKCARFKGLTMDMFIDRKEYSGNIFSIFESSLNFIFNHLNLQGEIKGIRRTDTYEIPVVALREALINALIHRDYINQGRDIKIGIYDDIVNIVSPGCFPGSITLEDIEMGRSDARNKIISGVLKELKLIEQWGSGVKRIKSSCAELGLKEPQILEKNDFVDVEIYRPITIGKSLLSIEIIKESIGKVSECIGSVSEQEQNVLEYLKQNNQLISKDIERLLNLKEARSRRILKNMAEKKLIIKLGSGKNTFYRICDQEKAL